MRLSRKMSPLTIICTIALLVLAMSIFAEVVSHVLASNPATPSKYVAAADNTAVTTYKEDNGRTGNHTTETSLTTSNVNSTQFGKHVAYPVDGQVYTQPLFLPNVSIAGSTHNVVYVATEHDSIYAFDADQSSVVDPLWHTSFINAPSVVSPSNNDVQCNDMIPEDGLSGTPVIDRSTGTLYVVVLTKENGNFVYRLHALDVTTGSEKTGSPVIITASVPGTGAGSVNGQVPFVPQKERQRASPLLANGRIYIGWGSFCDDYPYHGWIMSYAYNGSAFQQMNVYNDSPNSSQGGIWGAGGAVSADANGNIYYVSGNGGFDLASGGVDAGDSFVKLNTQLQVQDYFSPFNQQCLDNEDADLGSGGPLLLPSQHRFISAGKEGRIYVVDTTNMGQFNTIANVCNNQNVTNVDHILQELPPSTIGGLYSNCTYWKSASGQEFVYFAGANDHAKVFTLTNGTLATTPSSQTVESFGFTGGNPTVSSNNGAAGTGILWTVDPTPALRAYDATDLSHELYNSNQNANRDALNAYVKFTTATVANGDVFVGTNSTLTIYGLLAPATPTPTPSSTTTTPSPVASTTPTPTPGPSGYNSVGISDDGNISSGNFDGQGNSYSTQQLQQAGLIPGGQALDPGGTVTFTWPGTASGTEDNYQANGQAIPINPVPNAAVLGFLGSSTNGPSSGTATILYTDNSTQTFTLGFDDWTLDGGHTTTLIGADVIAYTSAYRNNPGRGGKEFVKTYIFYTSVNLQAGKTIASVQLPASVNQGQIHVFAIATAPLSAAGYNNVGISNDGSVTSGGFDGPGGNTYSTQALQQAGLNAGDNSFDPSKTMTLTWPAVPAGHADNYLATGQVVPINPVPNAAVLGFLGSSTNGPSSGTATILYTDNSTQTFTLGFDDWTLDGGHTTTLIGADVIAYTSAYRNNPGQGNKEFVKTYIFYASVNLQINKTIASVQLPSLVTQGHLHVFAITTSPPVAGTYNNVGITDDNNSIPQGGFDGSGGSSYSAQALQQAGLTNGAAASDPGGTVPFTWPGVTAGSVDNYQVNGQIIPITPVPNATLLGFLGSSTNGPSAGTATIFYTDGSTQTFILSFDDWTLNGGHTTTLTYGNAIAYTSAYRNNPGQSKEFVNTYVFSASVNLQVDKIIRAVQLPSSVNQGHLHVFAITTATLTTPAYNNKGISDDNNVTASGFDGPVGSSYSAQTLQQIGLTAGAAASNPDKSMSFIWPNAASGSVDNYQANGQTLPVSPVPNATVLGFLGSASNGPSSGTAVILYTDGSTQTFTLGFDDWALNADRTTTSTGDTIAYTLPYRNSPGTVNGHEMIKMYVFYTSVNLQAGKTIEAVQLPSSVNQGHLHVFAVATA